MGSLALPVYFLCGALNQNFIHKYKEERNEGSGSPALGSTPKIQTSGGVLVSRPQTFQPRSAAYESSTVYAASREALSMAMGSISFEERGAAAYGLLSLTNPASHKACRSALNRTFRYAGVSLRPR
jgi:hypothetical protein